MRSFKARCFLEIVIVFFSLFLFSMPAFAQEKVAIIPFKVFGPYEVQYLKDALPEMLYTRLPFSQKDIIKKEQLKDILKGYETKDELTQAKRFLDITDYTMLVMGAFTRLGDAISLDVKVLKKGNLNFKSFYLSTDKESKLFSALEDLSKNVVAYIQGRDVQEKIPIKEPERVVAEGAKKDFLRLAMIPLPFKPAGMVLADIDGDGKEEAVVATKTELKVFKIDNNTLTPLFSYAYRGLDFLSIDAGDFNKNGKDEIYLVGLIGAEVYTHVYEAKDNTFQKIMDMGWYVRVLDLPGMGKTLVGQRSGPNDAFSGDVYTLVHRAGSILPEKALGLARDVNIYQILPIKFKGSKVTAFFDETDYLKIMDEKGKIIARMKDRYGGSILGVEKGLNDNRESKFTTIHPRMFRIEDKDTDTDKILTLKNEGMRLFLRSKGFDSGRVVLLSFDGVSYKEQFLSEDMDGYVCDFAIDKKLEKIYVSVVSEVEEGRIFIFQNRKN